MKKFLLPILVSMMTFLITITITDKPVQAMSQKSLNNRVYLVTFINSNGYTTAHQYVFFTTNGKSAYVNVTDTDQSGKPVITKDSTKEEKAAPRTINRYLADRTILNKATSKKYYKIKNNKVTIDNGLITKKSSGKLKRVVILRNSLLISLMALKNTTVFYSRWPKKIINIDNFTQF